MKFYTYRPDAAGSYGENTVFVSQERPRKAIRLHYEFHLWPEEDMQCWLANYIGTSRLRQALQALSPPVSGIGFDEVEISGDDEEFRRVERKGRSDAALGKWYWFKITGQAGNDDFAVGSSGHLIISERVKELLIQGRMITNPSYSFSDYPSDSAGDRVARRNRNSEDANYD